MKWFWFLFSRKKGVLPADKPEDKVKDKPQTRPAQEWRYGVAGNITETHLDDQGILRYGSKAFSGGAKVYLCGKNWTKEQSVIGVIGLNRHKRVVFEDVPTELIENVRCTRVYKPSALRLMNDWEFADSWWDDSAVAKEDTKRFVELWNEKQRSYFEAGSCSFYSDQGKTEPDRQ